MAVRVKVRGCTGVVSCGYLKAILFGAIVWFLTYLDSMAQGTGEEFHQFSLSRALLLPS